MGLRPLMVSDPGFASPAYAGQLGAGANPEELVDLVYMPAPNHTHSSLRLMRAAVAGARRRSLAVRAEKDELTACGRHLRQYRQV